MRENYLRVAPRDLFNEAKLLKCLGQLALRVHERGLGNVTFWDSGNAYRIRMEDEYMYVAVGIRFRRKGERLFLGTTCNSRRSYPLICLYNAEEIPVFHEDGSITEEFLAFAGV